MKLPRHFCPKYCLFYLQVFINDECLGLMWPMQHTPGWFLSVQLPLNQWFPEYVLHSGGAGRSRWRKWEKWAAGGPNQNQLLCVCVGGGRALRCVLGGGGGGREDENYFSPSLTNNERTRIQPTSLCATVLGNVSRNESPVHSLNLLFSPRPQPSLLLLTCWCRPSIHIDIIFLLLCSSTFPSAMFSVQNDAS